METKAKSRMNNCRSHFDNSKNHDCNYSKYKRSITKHVKGMGHSPDTAFCQHHTTFPTPCFDAMKYETIAIFFVVLRPSAVLR